MHKWMFFLTALSLAGCTSPEELLIRVQLEKAVAHAEREAVEDALSMSAECQEKEQTWRAPIHSLTQDIRVQRCDIVYYYLARYALVEGDELPIDFIPSISFLGTENLLTGEKISLY
ncbi:hypothetical protein [Ectopseudomonas khazarica]|uniref:hypothetical protein n=1 Tax=Ectopseudomonas khazarica TaxID=2502979 RepID=UPI003A92E160